MSFFLYIYSSSHFKIHTRFKFKFQIFISFLSSSFPSENHKRRILLQFQMCVLFLKMLQCYQVRNSLKKVVYSRHKIIFFFLHKLSLCSFTQNNKLFLSSFIFSSLISYFSFVITQTFFIHFGYTRDERNSGESTKLKIKKLLKNFHFFLIFFYF